VIAWFGMLTHVSVGGFGSTQTLVPSRIVASLKFPWETCLNPSVAIALNYGEIVMRILSKRQVKELVLYSPQHVARLEKAGLFPKRVQLGPNRVGWVESEVLEWLEERLAQREVLN
jgi:prophage regulatory protein